MTRAAQPENEAAEVARFLIRDIRKPAGSRLALSPAQQVDFASGSQQVEASAGEQQPPTMVSGDGSVDG